MSFSERFNAFIKRIRIKHILFAVMCMLMALVVLLGCMVGGKVRTMLDAISGGSVSAGATEPSQTAQPS